MSDEFVKFPKIENHYQENITDQWRSIAHGQLFVAYEKLDGANIQFYFNPNGQWKVASRNRWLNPDQNFYGLNEVLEKDYMKNVISEVQSYAVQHGREVRLFGEIFGDGIQKRINYGPKRILFFDVMFDDGELQPAKTFEYFCQEHNIPYVEQIHTDTLSGFLQKGVVSGRSRYSEDSYEGYVIKPWENVLYDNKGRVIRLKFKTEEFNEKMYVSKSSKKESKLDAPVEKWHHIFGEYINDNRVLSVLSKEGPMPSKTFMGSYIKHVLNDAKEDFLTDYSEKFNEEVPDDKDKKKVFNYGSEISKMLLKHEV